MQIKLLVVSWRHQVTYYEVIKLVAIRSFVTKPIFQHLSVSLYLKIAPQPEVVNRYLSRTSPF